MSITGDPAGSRDQHGQRLRAPKKPGSICRVGDAFLGMRLRGYEQHCREPLVVAISLPAIAVTVVGAKLRQVRAR
jgi:hypothetical protein